MTSLQDLPLETLLDIIGYLSPRSLSNFALVNHACSAVSDTRRFQHIRLQTRSREHLVDDLNRWRRILRRGSRHSYVHRLTISCHCDYKEYSRWTGFPVWAEVDHYYCTSSHHYASSGNKFFYLSSRPLALSAAELDEEDEMWMPVAEFISLLPVLKDLVWAKNSFPRCVFNALQSRPQKCRLHILCLSLISLARRGGEVNEYFRRLVASPNLYTLGMHWPWEEVQGVPDSQAALQFVGMVSSHVREVYVIGSTELGQHPRHPLPWTGTFPGLPRDTPPRKLHGLGAPKGPGHVLSRNFFQAWSSHILFSGLRTLSIPSGMTPDAVEWLALNGRMFASLDTLIICLCEPKFPIPALERQQRDEAGATFLRSLPPLKSLKLNGIYGPRIFSAILQCHGQTLQQLLFPHVRSDVYPFPVTLEMTDDIRIHCPELRKLQLSVPRSQGDQYEVSQYRALSRLAKLEDLHIYFVCSDSKRSPRFTAEVSSVYLMDDAYIRRRLVDTAIDAPLARSIFNIISKTADGDGTFTFKDLTLQISVGKGGESSFRVPTFPCNDLGPRSYRCAVPEGQSEAIVDTIEMVYHDEYWDNVLFPENMWELVKSIWPEAREDTWLADCHSLPLYVDI
ncbi:hypothetical protein MGYG_05614 [Nannizzia gypsea CBS 118893]|uniref:F-box domain-containing protein n=1 Tax=Arthroderma gypseum (strain ATCC MYA-4604 / CBS 118893) TaxID=535722 RepID=E4UWX7_ARTGP|nr:hypothetical protein MGYG_05614 [Nannizzia gypsea CBS 118893]EFR02616.1 hypothetical protein MGYG_05614 [Nannizzia gypsea CBS 118893]